MDRCQVVIIIPTYNEALTIHETLSELLKTISTILEYRISILIFDSSSSDKTQQIVQHFQQYYAHLYLITEPQKTGLGSAYFQAMNYALKELAADIVFEFDADLSHHPKYIPIMLEKLKNKDVVVGSRYIPGGSIPHEWGWHRKLLSIMGNQIARISLTKKYTDFTSGFRASRKIFLKKIVTQPFLSNHYAYKLHLFWQLHQLNARIVEIPIEFTDRQQGYSKLPKNSIKDCLKVIILLRLLDLKKTVGKLFTN